jgi:Rad52/22 family double-strand break repair protein
MEGFVKQESSDISGRHDLTNILSSSPPSHMIQSRPGPGRKKVFYISVQNTIVLANQVFGPLGWSSSCSEVSTNVEKVGDKFRVDAVVTVTVSVTPACHTVLGYGDSTLVSRSEAIANAGKIARSDGLKTALRMFGSIFGLGLDDSALSNNSTAPSRVGVKTQFPVTSYSSGSNTAATTTGVNVKRESSRTSGSSATPIPSPQKVSSYVDQHMSVDDWEFSQNF